MLTYSLRLNEIITQDPIVSWSEENQEVDGLLYNSVIESYKYAYVNADNEEQFIAEFKSYWNRLIGTYRDLLYNQIALGENLYTARLEEFDSKQDTTETPNLSDNEDWTFGRKDETTYGRDLTITPNITETDKGSPKTVVTPTGNEITQTTNSNAQYDQMIVQGSSEVTRTPISKTETDVTIDQTHKRTGTETHGTSGTDSVQQSGTNTRKLTRTGEKTIAYTDTHTNKVTIYDADKFFKALTCGNYIIDKFIDLFSPLFNDIISVDFGRGCMI